MRRAVVTSLCFLLVLSTPHAQFGVLGRSVGQGVPPPTTPCDIVTGCVAAYSAQRLMLASYSGKLFQLKRSSDAFASTQDIGLVAGVTDYATILTYCGATSSFGQSTSTVNGCKFWKIYDQSGNGNDLTSTDTAYAQCLTPYAVNAAGKVIFLNGPQADHCHFGKVSPVNTPTGNQAISLYVAGNDTLWPVESTNFGYSMDFGMLHNFDPATCCPNGSDFDITLRSNGRFLGCGTCQAMPFLTVGVDLEHDVTEIPYGNGDNDATEYALSPNVASFSFVGDFTAATSYNASTSDIIIDFQYGLPSAQSTTINWNATNTTSMTGIAIGGGQAPEIRQGYTGDNTGATPSGFYEGAIYASTLTQTQLRQLETSGQTFYSIAAPSPCANGGVDLIGGRASVTGAWGLRQLDPTRFGAAVVIARADTGALKALGTSAGVCAPDVSTVAAFLSGTTGHVYDLPNQVFNIAGATAGWQGGVQDPRRFTSASSATTGPVFTLNGLNSTLPVMTFSGTQALTSLGSANAVTRPWSMLAAAVRTATSGGSFFTDGAGTNILGGGSANLLQVTSSSGTWTASSTDSTWHAIAGMTPTNTSIMACVNGTCTTSGAVTTGNTASSTWKLGTLTGAMTEMYLVNGVAVSSAQAAALAAVQQSIGGY